MARFTKDDASTGRRWYGKALSLDPGFADAYASLAWSYYFPVVYGWSVNPAADLNHASDLAEKALSLDDGSSEAMSTLCNIHTLQRSYDLAISECERAVAINPNSAGGYTSLATALTAADRPEEAVRAVEKVMRLDPTRRDFYAYFIAAPYVLMGRYRDAIPLLKDHLGSYPNQAWAHAMLIVAYVELGRPQEAQLETAELRRISPQFLARLAVINKNPEVTNRLRNDLMKAGVE
jgi:tetratricopeptide (TPR) repeat protein